MKKLIFTLPNGEQIALDDIEQMRRIGFDTASPEIVEIVQKVDG